MDVKGLLKRAADDYAPALGELNSEVNQKAFAKGSAFSEVRVTNSSPYKTVRDAMIDEGDVLLDDEDGGTVLAMIKGGLGGMAPVLLAAVVSSEGVISIGAYSKEGLIPQHASQRAIDSFEKRLRDFSN